MRPITVQEFIDFVNKQTTEEFYLGQTQDFTVGFIQNLNDFYAELQETK